MFQIRGLAEDPWASTQPEHNEAFTIAVKDVGSKIASFFTPTSTALVTSATPTPTTQVNTTTPVYPKPWYKTPIGMLAIAGGLFVGWKYVLPKFRK